MANLPHIEAADKFRVALQNHPKISELLKAMDNKGIALTEGEGHGVDLQVLANNLKIRTH